MDRLRCHAKLSQDGRILFLDPIVEGKKYAEIKAGKDPVCCAMLNIMSILECNIVKFL